MISAWDVFYLSSGVLTTAVGFPVAAVFIKKVRTRAIFWSSVSGFAGTILFYFLEKSEFFRAIEPRFMSESGVGFILYGIVSAFIGYFFGLTGKKDHIHN